MNALRFCLLVSLTMIQSLRADDDSTKANNMLNLLKQRSATDRWQRVKRQYPVDAPAPRRIMPAPLSLDQQRALADEELPPIPTEGFTSSRLKALSTDDPADWIRPARPIPIEEADTSSGSITPTRIAVSSEAITLPAVDPTSDSSGATNYAGSKDDVSNVKVAGRTPRTPIERMIGNINPYYDRDRDHDIRQFAVEKAKEFNIDFKAGNYQERSFPEITLAWEPTNFYYHPLYFEDPALERYGHAYPHVIQPLASIARFGSQFILLPYQMAILPPCKQEYPLGFYRPGECAPKLHYQIPLNAHAAVVEAAVVTGLFFAIP